MSSSKKDSSKEKKTTETGNSSFSNKEKINDEKFPGYPTYPTDEDIYSQEKEETDLDPENPTQMKAPNEPPDAPNEKNPMDDITGSDLDIPGAELDDDKENLGSEDEENNFYSLGGDDKESNEEDHGN
jgi:hypothetical protein